MPIERSYEIFYLLAMFVLHVAVYEIITYGLSDVPYSNLETKLFGNLHSCRTLCVELKYLCVELKYLCVELKYLDHNSQTIIEVVQQFSRNLTVCVFHSTWKKLEKEAKFWEKEKLVLSRCSTMKTVRFWEYYL